MECVVAICWGLSLACQEKMWCSLMMDIMFIFISTVLVDLAPKLIHRVQLCLVEFGTLSHTDEELIFGSYLKVAELISYAIVDVKRGSPARTWVYPRTCLTRNRIEVYSRG